MTGNYLLTNPLLRTHDTNPYNNLLAETVVCNTPSPPAFHSPGAHPPSTFTPAEICVLFYLVFWGNTLIRFVEGSRIKTELIPVLLFGGRLSAKKQSSTSFFYP